MTKFITTALKSIICNYSVPYKLVKRIIIAVGGEDRQDKQVIPKNYTPFTNCISETDDKNVDNAAIFDVPMPVHNLLEYSDNFSNTPRKFWQYCIDEPNGSIANSESCKYRLKFTGNTNTTTTTNAAIAVSLKCPGILRELMKW